jgi:uncharacterized spore protein YtfJ
MTKLIAILGALLLVGSLGAEPGGGDLRQEPLSAPPPSGGEAHAGAGIDGVAVACAKSDSTGSVPIGEMSDEEKERRKQVCDRENQFCCDRCQETIRDRKSREPCYRKCNAMIS